MEVRETTKQKMRAAISWICDNLSKKPMSFFEMQMALKRMQSNVNLIYLMKSAGYVLFSEGSWTLNRQKNMDRQIILDEVLSLYIKQHLAGRQRKKKESGTPPPAPGLISLSAILSKLPDEKLVEEIQRRGYIVFNP